MATKIKFYYNNLWDQYALTEGTQHSGFPAENTQHRLHLKPWRSRYGAGSGWGRFVVTASSNDRIDFNEGGGALVATLTAGTYTTATLCTEIKTRMDAAGGLTYTVTYSDTTNKFTIAGSGGFSILWSSGSNKARSSAGMLGYNDAGDDESLATYTADNLRIHTSEVINIDLGTAQTVNGAFIRYHNLSATATCQLQASADAFSTTAQTESFTIQDGILVKDALSHSYRYWRIRIVDVDNADGYVELGRVFIGAVFQPTDDFRNDGHEYVPIDPSMIRSSEGGQETSIQLDHYAEHKYSFIVQSQKSTYDTMFAAVGTSKPLFIIEDTDAPLTSSYYGRFVSMSWATIHDSTDIRRLSVTAREAR